MEKVRKDHPEGSHIYSIAIRDFLYKSIPALLLLLISTVVKESRVNKYINLFISFSHTICIVHTQGMLLFNTIQLFFLMN